jgi:hypothetical protein
MAKAGKNRKRVIWLLGTILVLFVGFFTWIKWRSNAMTLQQSLAHELQVSPDLLVINMPPAPGRYPGAVLVNPKPGQYFAVKQVERPATQPTASFTMASRRILDGTAVLKSATRFAGGSLAGLESVTVEMELAQGRVFEAELPKLRDELLANTDVYKASKNRQQPEVIVRAYEAIPKIILRRTSSISAEAWAKVKDAAISSEGAIDQGESVTIQLKSAVVVGFESATVEYVTDNFSIGGPTGVKLIPKRTPVGPLPATTPSTGPATSTRSAPLFLALSSPRYNHVGFANLPAASHSTSVMTSTLQDLGASALPTENPDELLATSSFQSLLQNCKATVAHSKPPLFIFYHAGHSISVRSGVIYLVMGDYAGNLEHDIGKGRQTGLLTQPGQPLARSNIDDIARTLDAIDSELSDDLPGLISVSRLHAQLSEWNVPFAVLIDGCYPSTEMDKLRKILQLTEYGDHYGLGDPGSALFRYGARLRQFADPPFLRATNVVILGAKPGSAAIAQRLPTVDWELAPDVGPLAAKAAVAAQAIASAPTDHTWGTFLRALVDQGFVGEIDPKGTISWSDFSFLDQLRLPQN